MPWSKAAEAGKIVGHEKKSQTAEKARRVRLTNRAPGEDDRCIRKHRHGSQLIRFSSPILQSRKQEL